MMRIMMFAATALLGTSGTGVAQTASTQSVAGDGMVESFPLDVAGVRLGMSPEQVRAALARAGYRIEGANGVGFGASTAAMIRQKAEQRRTGGVVEADMADRVVTSLSAIGPHRERLTVQLAPVPAGSSVVAEVGLLVPAEVMTGDAFLRQAVARYGKPDGARDGGLTLAWCSPALKASCGALVPFGRSPRALPNLTATTVLNRLRLTLEEGSEVDRRRVRAVAEAVDRAAPTIDRAAF